MRILLSAVGTRGDVQPIVAVAVRIRELGHEARLCVPPNFVQWMSQLGFEAIPVGVEMRLRPGEKPTTMPDLITDQFDAVGRAAARCDVILGANAHQYAARSIAEKRAIPYVTALYAPVAIPSDDHPPPPPMGQRWLVTDATTHRAQWSANARAWNERALERVNHNRERLGLAPIDDVLDTNVTNAPWLACDAALGPSPTDREVFTTGAWILEDDTPLAPELEAFLAAGEPPLYFGFGSMPAPEGAAHAIASAARALGRRAIVARGWAELDVERSDDFLVIGDVNQQSLFPRVAAIVHHGGAGTTAAAARAGTPQVIAPMFGDQFYWANRVETLGIGCTTSSLTTESLATALRAALDESVASRARSLRSELRPDGALVGARALLALT